MKHITDSWYTLYGYRKKIRCIYPDFWRIRIIKKAFWLIRRYTNEKTRILDVGSANRNLGKKLKKEFPEIYYKSMDIDRDRQHDYYSLEDIKEEFDVAVLFEVIEHIDFTEGEHILKGIKRILAPGGRLILTTPNVYHPNRYWEYSHKVSYRYDELGGLLLALGYGVEHIYRIYNDSFIKRLIRLYITAPVHRYFNIDFARSIAVVAVNK